MTAQGHPGQGFSVVSRRHPFREGSYVRCLFSPSMPQFLVWLRPGGQGMSGVMKLPGHTQGQRFDDRQFTPRVHRILEFCSDVADFLI